MSLLNFKTRRYIKKRAIELNITIPNNYEAILFDYKDIVRKYGYDLEFKAKRGMSLNTLNANAGFGNSNIIASPEWAVQLILIGSDNVKNAFKDTLGHELTHKENDIMIFRYGLSAVSFVAHVNEVHADFGGIEKLLNSSRDKALNAMYFKYNFKMQNNNTDIHTMSHPSWKQRINYIQKYNFDNELIEQIAADVNYKNSNVIKKVCMHYNKSIVLR